MIVNHSLNLIYLQDGWDHYGHTNRIGFRMISLTHSKRIEVDKAARGHKDESSRAVVIPTTVAISSQSATIHPQTTMKNYVISFYEQLWITLASNLITSCSNQDVIDDPTRACTQHEWTTGAPSRDGRRREVVEMVSWPRGIKASGVQRSWAPEAKMVHWSLVSLIIPIKPVVSPCKTLVNPIKLTYGFSLEDLWLVEPVEVGYVWVVKQLVTAGNHIV